MYRIEIEMDLLKRKFEKIQLSLLIGFDRQSAQIQPLYLKGYY